jgi:hypothetical protein
MNLSYKETSVKIRWNLFITFQTEAEQKNIKLKINNTLSEIDNLIRTDEENHILSHFFKCNKIY